MLYLIGMGLGGVNDLTLRGKSILDKCDKIYLESYTSVLLKPDGEMIDIISELKELLCENNKAEFIYADREMVESNSQIIEHAKAGLETALVVVGDALSATTHSDLILRAIETDVPYQIVHNASIMTVAGACGLQLYNYGETVSIPFWDDYFRPTSYMDKICDNLSLGLNTLCLLDIKVKEQSVENLIKGNSIFEPPRFMTCSAAAAQMLQVLGENNHSYKSINEDTFCVGLARMGHKSYAIFAGTLREMRDESDERLGGPLHTMIVVGRCHPMELSFLSHVAAVKMERIKEIYDNHEKIINSQ